MPDVKVHPHGDRWAVGEAGGESPLREYETREAAEMAARQLADGGAVEVIERDPTTLADRGGGAGRGTEDDEGARDPVDGMGEREHIRTEQGGL